MRLPLKLLLPRSLLAQVMVSVALALLMAQLVSITLLVRASEDSRQSAAITAAAYRLIGGGERAERRDERGEERRNERRDGRLGQRGRDRDRGDFGSLPRPLRYRVMPQPPLALPAAESEREEQLRTLLAQEGIDPYAAVIGVRRAGDDPLLRAFAESRPRLRANDDWQNRSVLVAAIQREPGGPWEVVRILSPPRPQGALMALVIQTLITFVLLIMVLYFVLRRITRPLAVLTERVGSFSRQPDLAVLIEESGPSDIRRLIAAHNAMETRIAALLDEKDVMLGAIGHDLKTPLAALRVRIESVADDVQRTKMAAGIEDITRTLDDILSLARVGRPNESAEKTNLAELVASLVEEYEDRGEPVAMEPARKVVGAFRTVWVQRALRNLIDNALRYGGAAQVYLATQGETAVISVNDDGPGIPEGEIAAMFEPFRRGEASRNRATGGAGLGLTLARAIAEQHGGTLTLANRPQGGLRAELRLPL